MPGAGSNDKGGRMSAEQDDLEGQLEEAEEAIDEGEFERAEEILAVLEPDEAEDPRLGALYGLTLYFQGEFEVANPYLERAHEELPEDPDVTVALAVTQFYGGDAISAEGLLRSVAEIDPEWAEAHWWLARVLDWRAEEDVSLREEADREFARAADLEPENFTIPHEFTEEEFHSAVQDAMGDLPQQISEAAEEVAVVMDRYPTIEILSDMATPFPPDLIGLYTGVPLPERSTFDSGRPPDVIHLFKRNLELGTPDPETLREEIRVTLIHEIGHYLGLEEAELDDLGVG
jgi:predicted Zn-dependent protease with MMP-like domain